MQGLGNDFVVINNLAQTVVMDALFAKHLSDRRYGVGCDQILLIEPAKNSAADFYYRIFNADGSEVYQCGNGARCVGLFIRVHQLSQKKTVMLETKNNLIEVTVLNDQQVKVSMGRPSFDPSSLPFVTDSGITLPYCFDITSLGNPHCVITVDDFGEMDIEAIAAHLGKSGAFPEGVNVGFMKVISRDRIELKVVERGAGLTKACGSGACAAVVCGRRQGILDATVTVSQAGGDLQVHWASLDDQVQLIGPAAIVFEGVWVM